MNVVTHTCNPSAGNAETSRQMSLRGPLASHLPSLMSSRISERHPSQKAMCMAPEE